MNPELSPPHVTPERPPVDYGQAGGEYAPGQASPEKAGEQSREREQNMQAIDRAAAQPPPPPVLPMPAQPSQVVPMPAPATSQSDDNNPAMAADDDLIEKEWVDKAKKVIAQTRNDPYKREQEVSKLQADYLRKRYGKEIGVST